MTLEIELLEKVHEMALMMLGSMGLELVDMTTKRQGHQTVIEILVDKPESGVTIEECSRFNRQLGDALELQNLLTDSYLLEVSSPGLDRPLKTRRDFERVRKHPVRFILKERVGEKGEYISEILEVNDQGVVITTPQGNLAIPFEKINVAKQHIKL